MTAPKAPGLIRIGTESLRKSAGRLGLSWELRPATVSARSGPDQVMAVYDGDTESVDMVDLTGGQLIGSRSMALFVPPAGNFLIGGRAGGRKQIAFAQRTSSSTPASAAQGVLRLDGVQVYAGNSYLIHTSGLLLFSTVAGDTASARLSYTEDGSSAGTGSSLLTIWNSPAIPTTGNGVGTILGVRYTPATNLLFSVLLFTIRLTGTGNISLFASPTVLPTQLLIDDLGPTIPDTGTII